MAERKSVLGPTPIYPELERLLEQSRNRPITEAQLREQRVSFAYGNAPIELKSVTKESVRKASQSMLIDVETTR